MITHGNNFDETTVCGDRHVLSQNILTSILRGVVKCPSRANFEYLKNCLMWRPLSDTVELRYMA